MSEDSQTSDDGIQFRLRRDLQCVEYAIGVGTHLVVKDSVKLEYFLFEPFESKLLNLLRKPISAAELKQKADQLLAPASIELNEVNRLLTRLLGDNLITTDRPGSGAWFESRQKIEARNSQIRTCLSVLAIRFRGINPQGILDLLNPVTQYFFRPVFLMTATILFCVAGNLNLTKYRNSF